MSGRHQVAALIWNPETAWTHIALHAISFSKACMRSGVALNLSIISLPVHFSRFQTQSLNTRVGHASGSPSHCWQCPSAPHTAALACAPTHAPHFQSVTPVTCCAMHPTPSQSPCRRGTSPRCRRPRLGTSAASLWVTQWAAARGP